MISWGTTIQYIGDKSHSMTGESLSTNKRVPLKVSWWAMWSSAWPLPHDAATKQKLSVCRWDPYVWWSKKARHFNQTMIWNVFPSPFSDPNPPVCNWCCTKKNHSMPHAPHVSGWTLAAGESHGMQRPFQEPQLEAEAFFLRTSRVWNSHEIWIPWDSEHVPYRCIVGNLGMIQKKLLRIIPVTPATLRLAPVSVGGSFLT